MNHKDIKCGTYAGYQRHYRNDEPSCDPCKAGASQYVKRYYHANHKKVLERARLYRATSSKRKAAKLVQKSRRRARIKGNRTEPYTLEQVLELYGTICYLCNTEIDMQAPRQCGQPGWEKGLHLDHVIDIQYGGADALDNVKPTHGLCNVTKGSKTTNRPPPPKG